jgi:hypothetical protein
MGTHRSVSQCVGVAIHGQHELHMVEGHTQTEHGKCVACWSGFPLQGVHRFESSRLSDMSNHLSCYCYQVVN